MQNDLNKPNRQNVINPRNNNQTALLLKTLVETDNLYISSLRKRGGGKKKKGPQIEPFANRQRKKIREFPEHYTEANSGGLVREGSGYFSSIILTITSESATHLSSNFTTGTFPSGLISKNLLQPIMKLK